MAVTRPCAGVHPARPADSVAAGRAPARLLGVQGAVPLPAGGGRSPRGRRRPGTRHRQQKVCTRGRKRFSHSVQRAQRQPSPDREEDLARSAPLLQRAEHSVFPGAARKAQGPAAALPARDPHPRAARTALSWVCRTHHPSPTLSVCPSCRSLITLKCINQTGTQANHPWKS